MASAVEDNDINPMYINTIDKFHKKEVENANKAADYWYHNIGANAIPADTRIKKACIVKSWKPYQYNPIPLEIFEKWKEMGLFAYGIAVVLGRLWRGKNADKHLNLIDADNQLAIQEICSWNGKTISIEQLADWTLVEQHKDATNKGHIYILSTKPFPTKASDKGKPDTANKIFSNEIPAIEVKNVGSLSFVWNSIHKGGYRYEFIKWDEKAALCDEFPRHIDRICKKYGLVYLDEHGRGVGVIPITELFKRDTVIYEGSNRHLQQLRVNNSLIARNKSIFSVDKIKQLAMEWNQEHCRGPLHDKEFDKLFDQSARFILKYNGSDNGKDDAGINEQVTSETKIKAFDSKQDANSNAKTYYVHKYSKGIPLAEAVMVAGQPYFIQMKGGLDFELLDKLTIDNVELKPKDTHFYLCTPYVFESGKEIQDYLKRASNLSNFDQIFKLVKTIIMKYVVAENHYLTLLAADVIYSYFQDKFGTTHYVICIGDNGSGKNAILMTFASLGYRVFQTTSVSAANVYTFLGSLEECQGTIAEDEINNLDNDPDKLNIYKSGYCRDGKVPKIDLKLYLENWQIEGALYY